MASNVKQKEYFYGWDLLYKTIERNIKRNSDVVVALAHYILTKEGNLRCVGLGDSKTLEEDDIGTELLPEDWNVDEKKYALRYSIGNELYILLGHITESALILNLLNVQKKSASNICFEPDNVVKARKGSLYEIIPTAAPIIKRIRKELIIPVYPGYKNDVSTQTAEPEPSNVTASVGERRPRGQFYPMGTEPRPFGFPDIGRSDLQPFGNLGSGMLFDFRNEGPFPRFDPIGPPGMNFLGNPNPDHFQPPGCGNNQFI